MVNVERIELERSHLKISRIGLGLAHMHTIPTARARSELIQAALDMGITHFDTARLYSDGASESALGEALAGRRDKVTIATKFGLVPNPFIASAGLAAKPLRKARSVLTRLGVLHYPRRSYTLDTLHKSIKASLKALRTDYHRHLFLSRAE